MTHPTPDLTANIHLDETLDGYRHIWHCEPPSLMTTFRVTHQTWTDNHTTRHIFEWEPAA